MKKDPAKSANEKHYPSKTPRIMPGPKSHEKMQECTPKNTSRPATKYKRQ
jgi:hypothetical protein